MPLGKGIRHTAAAADPNTSRSYAPYMICTVRGVVGSCTQHVQMLLLTLHVATAVCQEAVFVSGLFTACLNGLKFHLLVVSKLDVHVRVCAKFSSHGAVHLREVSRPHHLHSHRRRHLLYACVAAPTHQPNPRLLLCLSSEYNGCIRCCSCVEYRAAATTAAANMYYTE